MFLRLGLMVVVVDGDAQKVTDFQKRQCFRIWLQTDSFLFLLSFSATLRSPNENTLIFVTEISNFVLSEDFLIWLFSKPMKSSSKISKMYQKELVIEHPFESYSRILTIITKSILGVLGFEEFFPQKLNFRLFESCRERFCFPFLIPLEKSCLDTRNSPASRFIFFLLVSQENKIFRKHVVEHLLNFNFKNPSNI